MKIKENTLDWATLLAMGVIALVLFAGLIFVIRDLDRDLRECKSHAANNQPQPRYDCEDNSDTTKGHYKGVLTHCVPVEITRTM